MTDMTDDDGMYTSWLLVFFLFHPRYIYPYGLRSEDRL